MRKMPEILATATVARTRLFHVESVDLRFTNGVEVQYERLRSSSGGAVLIVPMLDDDTVLLIREYSAGVHRYELGLPKGSIEPGEDLLLAANRELMEEVGYGAHLLEHLTSLSLSPSYMNHQTHIVLARNLFVQTAQGDEPEPIEVVPWRLSQLAALLQRDDCTEARSIAALFIARELLAGGDE